MQAQPAAVLNAVSVGGVIPAISATPGSHVLRTISVPSGLTPTQFLLQKLTGIDPNSLVLEKWSKEWFDCMNLRAEKKWQHSLTFNYRKVWKNFVNIRFLTTL
jgi:hypothetical protein